MGWCSFFINASLDTSLEEVASISPSGDQATSSTSEEWARGRDNSVVKLGYIIVCQWVPSSSLGGGGGDVITRVWGYDARTKTPS